MSVAEVIKFQPKEVRMADLDDGYTRIANELLEKIISSQLTSRQLNVLLAIARKTYGYNKKTDWIGNKQLSALTGYAETRCSTIKNELINMRIVISNGRACGINKNLTEWNINVTHLGKTFTKTSKKTFTKTVNSSLPKEVNTKDNITKEKRNTPISPKGGKVSDEILELENQAKSLIEYYNTTRTAHCKNHDPFLKALKKYSFDDVRMVIDWFAETGKQNAKPENICRMTRFDGYLSDAIKFKQSQKTYTQILDKFNLICGEKLGRVDDLTVDRIHKIDKLIIELTKKTDRPLDAIEAYFETLIEISTDLDIKNPATNWEMTFDYVLSVTCLVKTREKYNRINGGQQ
ncbi:phage replication protein O [Orbus hercynius]|uniref:Phage replication protein O n=1 Tax=Orbus hercynius TaxID=593135 RepID=A0A495RIE7_9GAMM|nr:replication protein [Orbus hercynius]RKS87302.1 phage replication protein O [Orbus hercynius]